MRQKQKTRIKTIGMKKGAGKHSLSGTLWITHSIRGEGKGRGQEGEGRVFGHSIEPSCSWLYNSWRERKKKKLVET